MLERNDEASPEPTADERRRAVCDAMAISPGLIRFASRFTRSVPDAEDAYQRAMEIALTRAPVTDRKRFLAWLRAVLKNEALAIATDRRRESAGLEEDVADGPIPASGPGPEASAEWRARYLAVQDAIGRLTESQRICLMLQSAGSSYEQIAELTGFSHRKIERSLAEGRERLRAWEVRLEAGEVCRELDAAIERSAQGAGGGREKWSVQRHIKHCRSCRALLASRASRRETLAALVPGALVAEPLASVTPDPGPYLAAWDRAFGGATVRVGQLVQLGLELPGTTVGRVAAGAGALAVTLIAAVPIASDYVGADSTKPPDRGADVDSRRGTPEGGGNPGSTQAATDPPGRTEAAGRRARAESLPTPAPKPGGSSVARARSTTRADTPPRDRASSATRETPPSQHTGGPAPPPAPIRTPAPVPAPPPFGSADVVIPADAPLPSPDGVVIYGD